MEEPAAVAVRASQREGPVGPAEALSDKGADGLLRYAKLGSVLFVTCSQSVPIS